MSACTSKFPKLRLVTFNCLVQRFIDDEKYPNSLPDHLDWNFRWQKFQDMIRSWNADVLCLQEIDEELFKAHWHPFLNSLGYEAHYQVKPKWGNVTAFRTSRFSCQWIDSRSRALLCMLRCLDNDHLMYIANVHLSAASDRTEEKFNQVKSLCKQLEKHQKSLDLSDDSFSTIVCGDFNSGPAQGLYKLFTEGVLRADYRDSNSDFAYTKADFRLPAAMKSAHREMFSCEPSWTLSFQDKFTDTLDYVFYTPHRIDVAAVDDMHCSKLSKNIPNDLIPSDHLPLSVELVVRVSPIRRKLTDSA